MEQAHGQDFNKHLLNASYMPDIMLGHGTTVKEKTGGADKEREAELQAEGSTWAE